MAFELMGVRLIEDGDAVVMAHRERIGGFEPVSTAIWSRLAANGGTMIDAGAYTGFYSILAAINGCEDVIAFEPNPVARDRLVQNLELNSVAITLHDAALSARSGDTVTLSGKRDMSSAASIGGSGQHRCTARTMTIDALDLLNVTAIKIDVERSEYDVLLGAEETIARSMPHILIELLDDIGPVDRLLSKWGYSGKQTDPGMFHYQP